MICISFIKTKMKRTIWKRKTYLSLLEGKGRGERERIELVRDETE